MRNALASAFHLVLFSGLLAAQSLDPSLILKPLSDSWPTYSGDYSGKRYSALTAVSQSNVKNLTLAWVGRVTGGPGNSGGVQTSVGGVGSGEAAGGVTIKGSILQVDGILYVSAPDNAWAVDARDGHALWHYFWRTRGGTHIGNRGLGMWKDRLFMETPDNYLISIDAKTGKELWHVEIAEFDLQYFSTMAPIVVGDHVLVGTGNDLDEPGMLQSFEPETGKRQWVWYSVPMKEGDPGLETWKSLDAAKHGGGQMWVPGAYDSETHLYIAGTGNPSPAYTSQSREGDNLFTCALVAINVDTGKLAWYYQTSPHDTHDWDSTETPILVDAQFNGMMRKMVLHASRNGYYFTLDRVSGELLASSRYSDTANWAKGISAKGQPIRDPEKDFHIGGSLVSPNNTGVTNWPPPAFSPDTGLFYVPRYDSYAMYYLTETDPRGAMGLGGKEEAGLGSLGSHLVAIDYKTGRIVWSHLYPAAAGATMSGLLATAGKLLFAGDNAGNLIAFDPANGNILWHSRIGQVSNAPETYMLDGHQYILAAAGDMLFAFTLY